MRLQEIVPFIELGQSYPPPRAQVPPLRALNSSFIVSSRRFLRDLGVYEQYERELAPEAQTALDGLPTGVWAPVALAREHLEACDALHLEEATELDLGRYLAQRLHNPVLSLALRLAGATGATPMFLAAKAVKLWPKRNDGGDLLIVHTSARSASVTLMGYTLADLRHVRNVWRGTLEANARLLMTSARVTEHASACNLDTLVYTMTW